MSRKVTEDFIGTCQCCFGEFKVNDLRMIVLHGYQRPGHGYIIGNCRGVDYAPFEYDTTLTVIIINDHRVSANAAKGFLGRLKDGSIDKLTRRWQEYNRETRRYDDKSEIVEPGNEHWDWVLRREIANTESLVIYHTRVADFLQNKVDNWMRGQIIGIDVPATGLERALRKAYDPAEEDAAAARAAEKAKRDAKPGKLKVVFYKLKASLPDRDATNWHDAYCEREKDAKAWRDAFKVWAKTHTPGDKIMVREGYGSDIPRDKRVDGGWSDYDVAIVHLPWEHRDAILGLIPEAYVSVNNPKEVTYGVYSA